MSDLNQMNSGALHVNGQIWPVEPGANFSEDVIVVRVNSVVGFCVSLQSNHKHIPLYIL